MARLKTGSIQNRGTSWRISYYDSDHIRHFESWPTEDDAKRELAKRLAELQEGIPVSSKPNTVLFGELCKDVVNDYRLNKHRSVDDIEARFRVHIEPAFGNKRAAQIQTSQIRAYSVRRLEQGAKPGTVNRELEAIRRAFNLALKEQKILRKPHIPMLKENNVRSGFFTREEVDKLCSHLKEPYRSFVLFAFLTGWRYSEIQGLLWRNVDFQAGEIRLDPGTTKSGAGRVFPMNAELRELLTTTAGLPSKRDNRATIKPALNVKVLRMSTGGASVFSLNGHPIGHFRKSWRTACIKAGFCIKRTDGTVERVTRIFHDLRRSAVRSWILSGMPEKIAMMLSGHKTHSVLTRYAIVSEEDLRGALRYLEPSASASNKKSEA